MSSAWSCQDGSDSQEGKTRLFPKLEGPQRSSSCPAGSGALRPVRMGDLVSRKSLPGGCDTCLSEKTEESSW